MLRQRLRSAICLVRPCDATCIECAEAKLCLSLSSLPMRDATCIECAEAKFIAEHIAIFTGDATCIECAEAKVGACGNSSVEARMQPV